jgi:uncharacterized protein YejL (UPF0352 family)|tara:strand:- start:223 stop:405 length:183 start_codon:yes stop_codon:yes gene_type:complete
MAKKVPDEIANELYKSLNRLEIATDLIKAWVGYMTTNLSKTEELLVEKSKEFLGERHESR